MSRRNLSNHLNFWRKPEVKPTKQMDLVHDKINSLTHKPISVTKLQGNDREPIVYDNIIELTKSIGISRAAVAKDILGIKANKQFLFKEV